MYTKLNSISAYLVFLTPVANFLKTLQMVLFTLLSANFFVDLLIKTIT